MAEKIVVMGTRGIPDVQGGVETHVEKLYPRLVKKGYDVTVLCRKCYFDSDVSLSEYKGVKLEYLYAPKKKSFEAIIHSVLCVFRAKKLKADILHVHAIGPGLVILMAKMMGLKVVFTHHGPDYDRQKWNAVAKFMLKLGERTAVKHSNEVIVISEVIKKHIKKLYGRGNSNLIYNGVEIPEKVHDDKVLQEYGLSKDKYIFTAARFVEEKGFHDLINAYQKTKLFKEGYKLVLAGDADHETEYSLRLKEMAKKTPGIVLPGFIKGHKLAVLFSNAKLFVLPSYHEGLPFSLLEAMSYSLDVLISSIPAHKEIKLPKDNYFNVGDVHDLATALETIVLNAKLQRESWEEFISQILQRYDWNKIVDQTSAVYRKILD